MGETRGMGEEREKREGQWDNKWEREIMGIKEERGSGIIAG
jgi:hypothetical protein